METEEERQVRVQAQKKRIEESCNRINTCLYDIKAATLKMEKVLDNKKVTLNMLN